MMNRHTNRTIRAGKQDDSMKNTVSRITIGVLSALLLIGAIVAGTAYAGAIVKRNDLIDEQTAEEFAFLDAGVESDDISEIYTKLEYDHGQYEYDIKFNIGDVGYEYEIRARDGSVLSKEIENNAAESNKNISQPDDRVSQHEATDTDLPDQVLEQTTDKTTDINPTETAASKTQQNNCISLDQAKKTALDHAGLTENEVKFSSAKLENDDGIYEYEIEFYQGQAEYEYEIDAVTGEIINSETDYD